MIRAVAGILKRDDKVLVGERPLGKPYSGYWEFPGGKIESGESGEEALKRELFEELGVEIQKARCLLSHQHAYPDKTVFLEVWEVVDFIGEPQNIEHKTLRWVTLSEMRQLRLLEGNWAILEKLINLF